MWKLVFYWCFFITIREEKNKKNSGGIVIVVIFGDVPTNKNTNRENTQLMPQGNSILFWINEKEKDEKEKFGI